MTEDTHVYFGCNGKPRREPDFCRQEHALASFMWDFYNHFYLSTDNKHPETKELLDDLFG